MSHHKYSPDEAKRRAPHDRAGRNKRNAGSPLLASLFGVEHPVVSSPTAQQRHLLPCIKSQVRKEVILS